jgi:23S rRNA (pseudouridine1915-N3)-methyltransferase
VKPVPIKKGRGTQEILAQEGRAIAKRLEPRDYLIVLDRSGRSYDSVRLATWIDSKLQNQSCLCFVIGGPLGLSQEVQKEAKEILSLSKLTLTHEMARLILLEQIYRAFTIIRGEKYHK